MPDCRLCGASFPNWAHINGGVRNLASRKYCLTCSPWGQHNVRKLEKLPPTFEHKVCPRCRQDKPAVEFYLRGSGNRSHAWCKVCNNEHRKARFRQDRLAALLHYSGGDLRCNCPSDGTRHCRRQKLLRLAAEDWLHLRWLGCRLPQLQYGSGKCTATARIRRNDPVAQWRARPPPKR